MGDVLHPEERGWIDSARLASKIEGDPHGLELGVATIGRLVAEVERLRARNEALEKVAKAAGEDHRYHTRPESDECAVCDSLDALSALAEPGKGGAT